ncbi:MAG: S8 family serine peptidase [Sedimentisphaerales bacterium]|nr:S8 family serine peptidase [Sedimentisphaerales bacterium]
MTTKVALALAVLQFAICRGATLNPACGVSGEGGGGLYVGDRVIFALAEVEYSSDGSEVRASEALDAVGRSHRFKGTARFGIGGKRGTRDHIYIGSLQDGEDVLEVCASLRRDGRVKWAEPDYYYGCQIAPDDPYYSSTGTWGQAYADMWGLHEVNAEGAWGWVDGEGIVVAVIDTGVDYRHEDLYRDSNGNGQLDPGEQYNIWVNPGEDLNGNDFVDDSDFNGKDDDGNGYIDDLRGWDFINWDNDPIDDHGHGSHCAGIIAGVGDNGKGIIGTAPRAKIMIIKSLNSSGTGTASQLANGLMYAANNGAAVLSNSWGGGGKSDLIRNAVDYARSRNGVVVVAAGNDNLNAALWSPANIRGVVTVGAIDIGLVKASFSNFGSAVGLSAPGVDILSLRAAGTDMYGDGLHFVPSGDSGAKYYRSNGTSMACPFVSGACALLLEEHPGLSETAVRRALEVSAGAADRMGQYIGGGILDACSVLDGVGDVSGVNAGIYSPADDSEPLATYANLSVVGVTDGDWYVLEFGEGYYPETWSTISEGGSVSDGVLGIMDLSDKQGGYHIRLRVGDGDKTAVEHMTLWAEQDLHPGWPVRLGGDIFRFGGFILGASFNSTPADTDGDGAEEIFLSSIGHTFGIRGDGSILAGWPTVQLEKPAFATNAPFPGPAVADMEGDGDVEVLWTLRDYWPDYYGSPFTVWCFNGRNLDGSNVGVFPQQAIEKPSNAHEMPFVLADLDGDGRLEAVAAHTKGNTSDYYRISAFNASGVRLFTRDFADVTESVHSLSYGDIDGDGSKELAAVSRVGYTQIRLHVLDGAGLEKSGYPVVLRNLNIESVSAPPFLADIDGDGDLEVVVGTTGYQSYINCYHHDGRQAGGFPIAIGHYDTQIFSYNLGDIDGDGEVEVIVGANYRPVEGLFRLYVTELNGSSLAGWPIDLDQWPKGPVAIVDLDGDGVQDICFTAFDGSVHGYTGGGEPVEGFPKKMSFPSTSGVSVGDVDGDGLFELIAATMTGVVYVWDLPTAAYLENSDWPMRHLNPRNTNVFGDRFPGRSDCELGWGSGVDWHDLGRAALDWLAYGDDLAGDFNRDGKVDFSDIERCAKYWLSGARR